MGVIVFRLKYALKSIIILNELNFYSEYNFNNFTLGKYIILKCKFYQIEFYKNPCAIVLCCTIISFNWLPE